MNLVSENTQTVPLAPVDSPPVAVPQPIVIKVETTPAATQEPIKEDSPKDSEDETPTDVETKSLIPQENYRTSPLFYEVANFFGVDEREYENSVEKLSTIVDWAISETKSNKLEDILPLISKLERRLAPPTLGERRYQKVYQYIRLATRKQAMEKALSAFERAY